MLLISRHADASPVAAARLAAERERERGAWLSTARVLLGHSQDAAEARLALDVFLGWRDEELIASLTELRDRRRNPVPVRGQWDLDRVKALVLERAADGEPFSANRFYQLLPESAWPLIGPALQSLRHRHLVTVGTELAVHPARKRSRVTLYRLRAGADAPRAVRSRWVRLPGMAWRPIEGTDVEVLSPRRVRLAVRRGPPPRLRERHADA